MKTIITFLYIILFASIVGVAQPQWKFHIAFEDATGSRDTIWMIYDSTAHHTLPVDTSLGEGRATFDYSKFNVWVGNFDGDSTKTAAEPYTNYPYFGIMIYAFNYQQPLVISWDTSLFHIGYLPYIQGKINAATIGNEYFIPYNMLINDTAYAPWFSWGDQKQFPMTIGFGPDSNIININEINETNFSVSPNPAKTYLTITTNTNTPSVIIIYDVASRKLIEEKFVKEVSLNITHLAKGVYLYQITDERGMASRGKVVKE